MQLIFKFKLVSISLFILSFYFIEASEAKSCISPIEQNKSIILFVNGIDNTPIDAERSRALLEKKLLDNKICNSENDCTVNSFYNKTDGGLGVVGLNDKLELKYVSTLENASGRLAFLMLLQKIKQDYPASKEAYEGLIDTQKYRENDNKILAEIIERQENLLKNPESAVPFKDAGLKVTSWLINDLKENSTIPSIYNSILLTQMKKKESVYDDLFKRYYLEYLSRYFLLGAEYNTDRTDARYAITETVNNLVDRLELYISYKRNIVVVAHSQGNHIIELAHSILKKKYKDELNKYLSVVGVASVASTTPNNTYITWENDKVVLWAHNIVSNSPPLRGNFSTSKKLFDDLHANNHSFEKVYMNNQIRGRFFPQGKGNLEGVSTLLSDTSDYSIDTWVMGLIKGSLGRKYNADFTFYLNKEDNKKSKIRVFDATNSGHIDDLIESYVWEWGDGSEAFITDTPLTSHEYAEYGTYEVTFTYTTKCGVSNTIKKEIDVGYSLEKPTNLTAERNGDSISFSWDSVDGADGYDFYLTEELFDGSVILSDGVVEYTPTDTNITLLALDENKIYFVVVRPRLEVLGGKTSDILRVELQGVITETLSIPATLSREEGKNKFVPFTFTPIELKDKVDHVSCTTNPDIGNLFGTPSKLGVSFTAPAVNDVTSFIIKCAAYAEPKVLFETAEPLVVSNNLVVTVTQTVIVNNPPVASINGTDGDVRLQITVDEGASVNLDANSSSDPDSDTLTYKWLEAGLILNETKAFSKIFALGVHTVTLQVNDGKVTSEAKARIEVKEKPNTLPVARITSDTDLANVFEGDSIILKGDTSTDAEGAIKSYLWEELGQSIGTSSTISLPNLTLGKHFIKLTVTDSQDAPHSLQITIDAKEKLSVDLISQYTYNNVHTYYVYNGHLSWADSKSFCEAKNLHLATITSSGESTFIDTFTSDLTQDQYWIGGTDENNEGDWKWITGEEWSYENWHLPYEPNDKGSAGEDYLTLVVRDGAIKWNDLNPNQPGYSIGFICEGNLNSGLVAHYEFEDNANDSTVNANHGTEYGGVTYVDGVIGKAGSFDGIDDYIDVSHHNTLDLENFTLSTWLKIDSNSNWKNILLKGRYNGDLSKNQREYQLVSDQGSYFGTKWNQTYLTEPAIPEKWELITLTFNSSKLSIYKNGVLDSVTYTSESINNPVSPESLTIGSTFDVNNGALGDQQHALKGKLDDLRIYNRALSGAEVSELYKMGQIVNLESGLIAHYEFEDNANDSTENANHGTENGGVTYVDGVIGKAGSFDGIDDYIHVIPQSPLTDKNALSVSYFMKTDKYPAGIVSSASTSFENEFLIYLDATGSLESHYHTDTSQNSLVFLNLLGGLANNYWKHYVQVVNADKTQIFIDGILQKEISHQDVISFNMESIFIGAETDCVSGCFDSHQFYRGQLDDLRFYKRALLNNEITALYKLGNITTATGKLNDTGITQCADNSSNNLACPVSTYPNQDAQSGRDVTHNDDSDGHAGFSFTKISSTGTELPASATEWSCVKDNVTGLMWEVKTTDGGLHDTNNTYRWYNPDNTTNGGNAGAEGGNNDTNSFVNNTNNAGLCGAKKWRLPDKAELILLTDYSYPEPTLDTAYFPNNKSSHYWSSSPRANFKHGHFVKIVSFTGLYGASNSASNYQYVRLVHSK